MPINKKNKAPFSFDSVFRVYSRAVEGQLLFYKTENYYYFLKQYHEYLKDLSELHSWVLLPERFEFLISIKSVDNCIFTDLERKIVDSDTNRLYDIISRRFKNLFLSHSHFIKNRFDIRTNVFAQKFRHELIEENDLKQTICSIHHLPVHYNITYDWEHYPWSSYSSILFNNAIGRNTVIDRFGSRGNFIDYHQLEYLKYKMCHTEIL